MSNFGFGKVKQCLWLTEVREAQLEELREACVGLHADNRVFLVTPRGGKNN